MLEHAQADKLRTNLTRSASTTNAVDMLSSSTHNATANPSTSNNSKHICDCISDCGMCNICKETHYFIARHHSHWSSRILSLKSRNFSHHFNALQFYLVMAMHIVY